MGVICEAKFVPPTISLQLTSCGIEVSTPVSASVRERSREMLPDDLSQEQQEAVLSSFWRGTPTSLTGLTWTWDTQRL